MLSSKTLNISLFFLLIYSTGYYLFGERIALNNGFGWDGVIYGAYAQNFWALLRHTNDIYHINRILPSFIIYCILKLLHLNTHSPVIIVKAFTIFNSILFIGCGYLWFKICYFKQWTANVYWFGFISLFINYLYLKHNFYDPVLTDTAGLFLGMLSLYFYIHKKYLSLAIILIPAYFTWPISTVLLAALLLFPDSVVINNPITRVETLLSILFTLLFISICIYLTYILGNTKIVSNSVDIYYPLLPFSIALAAIFIFFMLRHSYVFMVFKHLFIINYRNLLYLLGSGLICYAIYTWLKIHLPHYATDKSIFTIRDLLTVCILGAIAKPGIFFISHLAFWGPVVILIFCYLKEIMKTSLQEGLGVMLFMLATAFLALNSQTRQIDFNYPFIVYLLCLAIPQYLLNYRSLFIYLIVSIIVSKVYYIINVEPLTGSILTFPYQRFMMNSGTYMNWGGYFVNTGLFLISIVFMRWGFFSDIKTLSLQVNNEHAK